MDVFTKGLITVVACNTLISLLAIPLILRKVPRNPLYGYRTRKSMRDDQHWYAINAYFGLRLFIATLCSTCVAMLIYAWQGLSPQTYLHCTTVLLAAPALIAWLLTARFIRTSGVGISNSALDR